MDGSVTLTTHWVYTSLLFTRSCYLATLLSLTTWPFQPTLSFTTQTYQSHFIYSPLYYLATSTTYSLPHYIFASINHTSPTLSYTINILAFFSGLKLPFNLQPLCKLFFQFSKHTLSCFNIPLLKEFSEWCISSNLKDRL